MNEEEKQLVKKATRDLRLGNVKNGLIAFCFIMAILCFVGTMLSTIPTITRKIHQFYGVRP